MRFQISFWPVLGAFLVFISNVSITSAMPTSQSLPADISAQQRRPSQFQAPPSSFASDRVVLADRPPTLAPRSIVHAGNADLLVSDAVAAPPSETAIDVDAAPASSYRTDATGNRQTFGTNDTSFSQLLRRLRRSAYRAHGPQTAGLPSLAIGGGSRMFHDDRQQRYHQQHQQSLLQPVCASVSEWVRLTEAEDFLGNRVRLAHDIDNGSSRVDQYFFETYCSSSSTSSIGGGVQHHEGGSCAGIDSTRYDSVCYETHTLVYGLVADYSLSGDGWTFIKIRSGCNCGLLEKRSGGFAGAQSSSQTWNRHRGRGRNN
jgi:hypothetical protein